MPPSYFGTRWFSQLVRRCGLGDATHRIFVDESGDPTLFDGDGNVIVGREGVSQFFMLGAVHLPNPDAAHRKLERLRRSLLADPYFATAPSMSKTALTFHAKNDLDEVKREVFRILPELGGTVQIAVRRKHDMVREARELFQKGMRLTPNMAYDDLVGRMLVKMIPAKKQTHILFARRGKSDRIDALRDAISQVVRWQESTDDPSFMDRVSVAAAQPHEAAGLQIVDYYLWAVQRLFEKRQPRFYNSIAGGCRLILDLDDQRNSDKGEVYHAGNPLTPEKIKPVAG